jgi:hypothetical protein
MSSDYYSRPIDTEADQFPCFSRPDGSVEVCGEIRRNGVDIPRPIRPFLDETASGGLAVFLKTYRIVTYGLRGTERRLWIRLLSDPSLSKAAKACGTTRAALYSRIRGDGKSQKGMIARNWYVKFWWENRRKTNL